MARTRPTGRPGAGSRWRTLGWLLPTALVALVVVVLLARWLRTVPAVADFLLAYPGETDLPEAAPVGFPAWLAWQHFLNAFFLVFIIRSGLLVRSTQRPKGHWQRRNTGRLRTAGKPARISLNLWLHLAVDILWTLNGLVFMVLIFITGQWLRIVPISWEVFPHAASVAIQYLSLDWPAHASWVSYNALQLLAYFVTTFVAAPLALLSGLRMSPGWPKGQSGVAGAVNRVLPVTAARAMHFPIMIYFVAFTVMHVTLVLSTGAQANLNHMFAARNDDSWLGLIFFAGAVVLMVGAWVVAKPAFTQPVAALTGKVTR
ncbi:cytochrome b/b6 domain-containing protein [Georgenia sunbinii]|uniref:cytochrome b/b6 domain-containing protein n=1 Tax=Georgenia sunbinii TaxID=3117728 RepID=UPI002F266B37